MKKIYNQPTCLVVALGTCKMMAESLTINSTTYDPNDENTFIGSSDQILTKENKNLWDDEW